jgi:2-keto-4-pentenoate hydratase/2-oxohepta-3-ene-1,7-dioic acid hydratase in catechol pathway
MKLVHFTYNKAPHWGILEGEKIQFLREPPYRHIRVLSRKVHCAKVKLLAPASPRKIVLAGLNYKDHAKELKMRLPEEPMIFLKPPDTLLCPGGVIRYPQGVKRLDYEAELAVVIKREAKNISARQAHKHLLGLTCLNDVTARDLQAKDGQWTRAKSFDTFCPLGPAVETSVDAKDLSVKLFLNGTLKQDSSTRDFIFPLPVLVAFISRVMTLFPGDVISTGTPSGVGPMRRGDRVEVEIEGVGRLINIVG